MSAWYRVFGANDAALEPAALLEHLRRHDAGATGKFTGDDQGWFRAELSCLGGAVPLVLERYLSSEDGVRAELNTWAAWLETNEDNPHHAALMERVIGSAQVFTLHCPADDDAEEAADLCVALCRYLAHETAGVYQADAAGFLAADGTLLIPE